MTHIIALLIVGARREPWLPAVLESLADGIDTLVVNDNSGDRACENRRALETSRLHREGRVDIIEAPFVNFSDARNRCLVRIREHHAPRHDDIWILKVDADEVHDSQLAVVTRTVLPALSRRVGVVDGYFLQFMQSLRYYISLDRRHELFFRYTPDLRWEREVHEQLRGLMGRRLCLPYVFFHYGYASDGSTIAAKWSQYRDLGDPTFRGQEVPVTPQMFDNDIPRCLPLTRRHPAALQLTIEMPPHPAHFHARVVERLAQPGPRANAMARRANYRVMLLWRALQSTLALPPTCWLALVKMALI